MAVRVTAGRITIAALLAVGLGLVSYTMPEAGRSTQTAQTTCATGVYSQTVAVNVFGAEPTDFMSLPMGAYITNISASTGSWCPRDCSNCNGSVSGQCGDEAEQASCDDGTNVDPASGITCAQVLKPCYESVAYFYDASGNQVGLPQAMSLLSGVVSDPSVVKVGFAVLDNPYYDNSGTCSAYVQYVIPGSATCPPSSSGTTGGGGSSTPTTSSTSFSSTSSFDSSSSSSDNCGDGVEQNTGPGPDGIDGTADDMEQCDDGNADDADDCRNDCTVSPSCGDGIVQKHLPGPDGVMGTPDDGEQCDDGNADDADDCRNDCTVSPSCGDGIVQKHLPGPDGVMGTPDDGEQCDDGNTVDNDFCTNACFLNNACGGDECDNPVAIAACNADGGKICKPDNAIPCIKCVSPVVGVCEGNECSNGGNAFCTAMGEECSLTGESPCVTCIHPNQCGNGRIDSKDPITVDDGCAVTGTSNQLCMPEGVEPGDQGVFQESDRCYQGEHCRNVGGSCAWVMRPELEQCLQESGGGLPEGCFCQGDVLNADCPVQFQGSDPCGAGVLLGRAEPSRLAAQLAGGAPKACNPDACAAQSFCTPGCFPHNGNCVKKCHYYSCMNDVCSVQSAQGPTAPYYPCDDQNACGAPVQCPTDVAQCCGADGNIFWVSRDPSANCQFPKCNLDLSACSRDLDKCVRAGCNGSQCVPRGEVTVSGWCSIDPKAACYDMGTCGTKPSGGCGWLPNAAFDECMNDNTAGTCPSDASCLTRAACADVGGTVGNACGADDTNVCCSGGKNQPGGPVEACDDGNQIDDDACGNDCEINCSKNADCPEGACVNGQCVDQCVEPDPGGGGGGNGACFQPGLSDKQQCDCVCQIAFCAEGTQCGLQNGTCGCYDGTTPSCPAPEQECAGMCARMLCQSGSCCGKDPATGRCGCNAAQLQGAVPTDFLSRLMAQQVSGGFKLLP